jgi:hypothetical protein
MDLFYYILLGLFWIVVCIGLGLYINGKGFSGRKHHTFGLKSIVVSYIIGICMLFTIIIFS